MTVVHHAVVANAVDGRHRAGHDRDVRRQRQRHGRARVEELPPALCERVDIRHQSTPEPVSTECVDRDEQNVRARGRTGSRCGPPAAEHGQGEKRGWNCEAHA